MAPPKQHRQIFEAVFWISSCDVPWRALPEQYGKWNTVYRQFKRWSESDLWDRVLQGLDEDPELLEKLQGLRQNMLSTQRLARQRHSKPQDRSNSNPNVDSIEVAPPKYAELN